MSICSDVYISLDEARQRVKAKLMRDQEELVDQAIKGMSEFDLSCILNRDSDIYYYHIEKKKRKIKCKIDRME